MQIKTVVALSVVAILGVSSTAMARGGGHGGGGWSHGGMSMHGNAHFDHRRFDRRFRFVKGFNRNLFLNGGWGWGGDWGWGGYGDSGYGNTTIVAFPQATPAGVTGSISTGRCQWESNSFTVPSSAGGTRPVEVVSCR